MQTPLKADINQRNYFSYCIFRSPRKEWTRTSCLRMRTLQNTLDPADITLPSLVLQCVFPCRLFAWHREKQCMETQTQLFQVWNENSTRWKSPNVSQPNKCFFHHLATVICKTTFSVLLTKRDLFFPVSFLKKLIMKATLWPKTASKGSCLWEHQIKRNINP